MILFILFYLTGGFLSVFRAFAFNINLNNKGLNTFELLFLFFSSWLGAGAGIINYYTFERKYYKEYNTNKVLLSIKDNKKS